MTESTAPNDVSERRAAELSAAAASAKDPVARTIYSTVARQYQRRAKRKRGEWHHSTQAPPKKPTIRWDWIIVAMSVLVVAGAVIGIIA